MVSGIASVSYALAALAYALMLLLALSRWRRRPHAASLALACALTLGWSAVIAWREAWGAPATPWLEVLEIGRDAGWTAFLLRLLGQFNPAAGWRQFIQRRGLGLVAGYYLVYLLAAIAAACAPGAPAGLAPLPGAVARAGLAVLGMMLVEQLYRNKPAPERWALKFACIGIGGMFAYDFYLFSDAVLFRHVNADIWAARGLVNALTAPLIAVSVARHATWTGQLALSRRLLYHSATLFGAACYLLAMDLAGYYLRHFGGTWGAVMQASFLFGAAALLAGILFSGTVRSWLKVFISKHFYSYNYDYREEWQRFTRMLSQQGPGLAERSIQAIAELVESPAGALWVRRESGLCEPLARWHLPAATGCEPAGSDFCRFMEQRQWVVDLQEYERAPALYGMVRVPDWLRAFPRAWLVVPLILQGRLFGFVLLLQPRSPVKLNWEVIDLLRIAGSQAASYLAQQEAAAALMLARQFESFNRMSTFVVHDLKNLVAQLGLLIPNARKHRDNPEFQQDMLDTLTLSVQKMKLMLQKLSRGDARERPLALQIDQLLGRAVALTAAFEPAPLLAVEDAGLAVLADGERLERVLGHLIQNAVEATPRDGSVTIRQRREGASVRIEIIDSGVGMTADFIRERLYRPFDSTKSAGMGIGAFESREYIRELGGVLEVSSVPGRGTTFAVTLPLHQQAGQRAEQAA